MNEEATQAALASLSQRDRLFQSRGFNLDRVQQMIATAIASQPAPETTPAWRLYDLTPATIASGTSAGAAWTATGALAGVPTGATHAYVRFYAQSNKDNSRIEMDFRRDASDSIRPAVSMPVIEGAQDSNSIAIVAMVPLASGQFDYRVTGVFDATGTSWSIQLFGYFA